MLNISISWIIYIILEFHTYIKFPSCSYCKSSSTSNLICKVSKNPFFYRHIYVFFFSPKRSPIQVSTVTSEVALCDRTRINESCVAKDTGVSFVLRMIWYCARLKVVTLMILVSMSTTFISILKRLKFRQVRAMTLTGCSRCTIDHTAGPHCENRCRLLETFRLF